MFGGYFNSRLNANLRETHGYTYGVRSRFDARRLGGSFFVNCDVRTSVTDSAIAEIMHELKRIVTEPVPDTELTMVKNYVSGQFPLTIETPQQVANQLQNIELYGLPKDYYTTIGTKVRALTAEDLFTLAKKYIHPDRMNVVVAGDSKKLTAMLKQIGLEEVTDSDGKVLSQK
jgi:predicted Zn-dependent peptidase